MTGDLTLYHGLGTLMESHSVSPLLITHTSLFLISGDALLAKL